ncbi:hypothetical protein ABIF96_005822 [Bradyrhizobium ottawaense]|uniref:hypothetical protein n=1 Tax=Bradyrhizobium ottawaense TaxID=931866 RepID=UPI0038334A5B
MNSAWHKEGSGWWANDYGSVQLEHDGWWWYSRHGESTGPFGSRKAAIASAEDDIAELRQSLALAH